jgi:hypothetical protein
MALIQKHNRGQPPMPGTGLEDPASFDWFSLGEEVSDLFRTCPGVSCMLGPLTAEVRQGAGVRQGGSRQLQQVVLSIVFEGCFLWL